MTLKQRKRSVHINGREYPRFNVDPTYGSLKVEVLSDRSKGRAIIRADMRDNEGVASRESVEIVLNVISCWVDPFKGNVIKFFATWLPNKINRNFIQKVMYLKVLTAGHNAYYSVSKDGSILRYGNTDRTADIYNDQSRAVNVFDNKAAAVRSVLEIISRYRTVGGVELINFDSVPDDLLLNLGMQEVKDEMQVSPSMWIGNISEIFGSTSRYDFGWNYRPSQETNELIDSFLEILTQSISQ